MFVMEGPICPECCSPCHIQSPHQLHIAPLQKLHWPLYNLQNPAGHLKALHHLTLPTALTCFSSASCELSSPPHQSTVTSGPLSSFGLYSLNCSSPPSRPPVFTFNNMFMIYCIFHVYCLFYTTIFELLHVFNKQ